MNNYVALNEAVSNNSHDTMVKRKSNAKKNSVSLNDKVQNSSQKANPVKEGSTRQRDTSVNTKPLSWFEKDNVPLLKEAEVIRFGVRHKANTEHNALKIFQSIEEAISQADELQQFIDKVLTEGVDYGIVKGYSKPTLLKSGAERLCRFFGVVPVVEITNRLEDYSRPLFSYEARINLSDADTGIIKATGIGLSNSREVRYRLSDPFTMQNTILKMAKKRALVDATLNLSGLSSRFTQDIEDFMTTNHGNASSNSKPITKQQYDLLCSAIKDKHLSEDSFNAILSNEFRITTWKCLNYDQMALLISAIEMM